MPMPLLSAGVRRVSSPGAVASRLRPAQLPPPPPPCDGSCSNSVPCATGCECECRTASGELLPRGPYLYDPYDIGPVTCRCVPEQP